MFEINQPALDYITLTTFNQLAMETFKEWHESVSEQEREGKQQQYQGTHRADRYGTSFLGSAEQKSMMHSLLRVSGMLSSSAFSRNREHITAGRVKVTRIDLQVTIDYERSIWSQFDLCQALKLERPDRSISFHESKSGPQNSKLATVYYGSRTSERFCRIYEKRGLADDVHLRYEWEYKGQTAQTVAFHLLQGESVRSILMGELTKRIPDTYNLRRIFEPALTGRGITVRTVREPGGTAEWLKVTVLPALDRYLNDHNEDSTEMASLFHAVILPHLP